MADLGELFHGKDQAIGAILLTALVIFYNRPLNIVLSTHHRGI
jgi:hypothetical protein